MDLAVRDQSSLLSSLLLDRLLDNRHLPPQKEEEPSTAAAREQRTRSGASTKRTERKRNHIAYDADNHHLRGPCPPWVYQPLPSRQQFRRRRHRQQHYRPKPLLATTIMAALFLAVVSRQSSAAAFFSSSFSSSLSLWMMTLSRGKGWTRSRCFRSAGGRRGGCVGTVSTMHSIRLCSSPTSPSSSQPFPSMETTVRDYGKAFEGGRRGGVAAAALPVPDASTALGGPRNVAYMDEKRVEEQDTIYALSTGSGGAVTAVAVIRISGPHVSTLVLPGLLRSSQTVKRVLRGPRFAHLCTLYEPRVVPNGAVPTNDRDSSSSSKPSSTTEEGQQHALDRAIVLYFPGPKSFTGEDVLELHLHGSRVVVSDVLEALETIGQQHHRQRGRNLGTVRMAEPGEFTQRAFASGKLDALQTEALADLLHSDTSRQRQQALKQLDGSLSKIYQNWRNELIAGLAHAEALIDFGDDEHLDDTEDDERIDDWDDNDDDKVRGMSVWGGVVDRMDALRAEMQRQLSDERRGELVREGVRIVVTGPPNAGKSTLFNLLAQRDAAIVSPHAGTTRDVLEVQLNLRGVKCRLLDTAGIRSGTCDDIERIGIDRAVTAVRSADVVVAMLDATDTEAGMQILRSIAQSEATTAESDAGVDGDSTSTPQLLPRGTPMLLVLNKSDLAESTGSSSAPHDATRSTKMHDTSDMPVGHPSHASLLARARMDQQVLGVFEISCVTQQGLDEFLSSLASTVVERVSGGGSGDEYSSSSSSSVLITRTRHRQHVTATVACLERFLAMAGHGAPVMDLAAEELRLAASELGRVTGAVDVEDVLDKLFADFCIGK